MMPRKKSARITVTLGDERIVLAALLVASFPAVPCAAANESRCGFNDCNAVKGWKDTGRDILWLPRELALARLLPLPFAAQSQGELGCAVEGFSDVGSDLRFCDGGAGS